MGMSNMEKRVLRGERTSFRRFSVGIRNIHEENRQWNSAQDDVTELR